MREPFPRRRRADCSCTDGRKRCLQFRKKRADAVDDLNRVGSRLARYREDDAARPVVPGDRLVVFDAVNDVGELFKPQGYAVAVLHNQRAIGGCLHQLAAGLDCECLFRLRTAGL